MRVARPLLLAFPFALLLLAAAGSLSTDSVDALAHVPAYVPWLLPVLRVLRDVLGALAIGYLVIGGLVVKGQSRQMLYRAGLLAAGWATSAILLSLLTFSEALGLPLTQVAEPTTLFSFYGQTSLGRVFVVQVVAALLVSLMAPAIAGRASAWVVSVIALAGVAAPAFIGHGGLSGGHTMATIGLALHVIAISVWLGGLVAVCNLAALNADAFTAALPRFSALALGCVIVVAETGLLNATLRITTPGAFLSSWYGVLVLAKILLLGWLVLLGWRQRRTMAAGAASIPGMVVRVAGWEITIMAIAVAISVVLARVGPPGAVPRTDAVLPLAAALLAFGIPLIIQQAWPRRVKVYPEVAAVILVVVLAVAVDVGVFAHVPAGSIPAAALLLASGWLFVTSLPQQRSGRLPGLLIVAMAWPVVVWFGPQASVMAQLADVMIGEGLLFWMYLQEQQDVPVPDGEVASVSAV